MPIGKIRTRACDDQCREYSRTAQNKRNRRSFQIKPCPVGSFYPKKTICGSEKSTKCKGQRKKRKAHDKICLLTLSAACRERKHCPKEKFDCISRPRRQRQKRIQQCKRTAQPRRKQEPPCDHLHAGCLFGKIEQQPVQQGIFQKCVLPIDDHLPLALHMTL